MVALPLTLVILLLVLRLRRRRSSSRCLLAITAVMATTALIALPEPARPGRRVDRGGDPARSASPSASTTRSSTSGANAKSVRPGAASALRSRPPPPPRGRAVLISGDHRADRDGRHVPLRRQDVHVLLDRHDDGRRRSRCSARSPYCPALLGRLGDRVEKGRIPFVHRLRRKDGESRFWGAILDRVLRRPVVSRPSPRSPCSSR